MEYLCIEGGVPLQGSVETCGAKNAVVAMLPAAVLAGDQCMLGNVPSIKDVSILQEILANLGASVTLDKRRKTLSLDTTNLCRIRATSPAVRRLRASYYFLGALLGRFGEAEVSLPGGCEIGTRPIDQHLKGMRLLGAEIVNEGGVLHAKAKKLVGADILLDMASVGATINLMLCACRAQGLTVIKGAAKEPHVVDTANFLNSMGASIKGAGTDTIRIHGVQQMHGSQYNVIPDQIEAGTLMIAAAATKGDVLVRGVIPPHMEALSIKLVEMGATVEEEEAGCLRVRGCAQPRATDVQTRPYPGFPTDMQQPLMAMMCTAKGTSKVEETIYEQRFKHTTELGRMGADIQLMSNRLALVHGVEKLTGTYVEATDLRAGAAMVIAGLMAEGITHIANVHYIDRGYECIEEKLISLGARIRRVNEDESEQA